MWRLIAIILVFIGIIGFVQAYDYEIDATTDFNKVIFTINGDGTISMILYGDYQGDRMNDKIYWLIPLPSQPTVDILPPITETLFDITNPALTLPSVFCDAVRYDNFDAHRYDTGSGWMTPLKTKFIAGTSLRYVIDELQANGYFIGTRELNLLHDYIQKDMSFLLLTVNITRGISPARPTSEISPAIKITYRAENPVLPLLITSTSVSAIWVWIFGDSRYIPQHYPHPTPDYATFRTTPRTDYSDEGLSITYEFLPDDSVNSIDALHTYHYMMNQLQDEYNGMFITEFASATEKLIDGFDQQTDPFVADLLNQFNYVTRLRGQFDPDQIVYDELFVPAPDLPDVAQNVDLNDYVDPLHFWGCSSRELMLNDAELWLDETMINGISVPYPKEWVRHDFLGDNSSPLTIFSPQPIASQDLSSLFNDQQHTSPMYIYIHPHQINSIIKEYQVEKGRIVSLYEIYNVVNIYFKQIFGEQFDFSWDKYYSDYQIISWSNRLYTGRFGIGYLWRGLLILLTTAEDYHINQSLYDLIRRSFNDYTFYASPYLRHTLFLGSSFKRGQYYKYSDILYASRNIIPSVYFGFPEGWGERMMPNDEVWVTPQNDQDNADAPRIRLIPYENLGIYFNMRYSRDRYFDIIATRLRYIHQLDSTFEHYLEYHASQSCVVDLYTYPYESNGRKGYITLSDYSSVILEVSVPTELFDVYEKVLRWSADSFRDVNAACG